MTEHTPTPWAEGEPRIIVREVPGMCDGGDYYAVAETHYHSLLSYDESIANAAFIIKAVNNHEEALDIIESLLGLELGSGERAMAFLDRVKGGQDHG
jgi:hypothetical protein